MIWRRGITVLALLLALGGYPLGVVQSAFADEAPTTEAAPILLPVDETEILILEVMVERYLGSRGVMGYRHGDQVLLPLGELAAVLELAVTVDPYTGMAEGWINDEDDVFQLDVPNRRVTIGGRQSGIDQPCLYIDPDDIYVTSEVLGRWWPVDVDVDLRGMRVSLSALGPVPLVSRLERERSWEKLDGQRRQEDTYPRQKGEYRTLSWPFVDATVSFDANETRSVLKGSLLSRNDLARMSMTGFVGYSEGNRNEWTGWLRAERNDPEAGLLGFLGATRFQVGDVVGHASQFIKGTTRGRGVLISNRPLGAVTEFGATDMTGEAPPGWEAELYRDGYLHAIQTVSESGTYLFEKIPVHPGLNTMRVVLYGPNGQTREEMRTVNITSSMWRPGQLAYEYMSHQSGESVVGSRTSQIDVADLGHWFHSLSLGYGVSTGTSVDLSASRRFVEDRDHDYLQARIMQSVDRVLLEGRGIHDLESGNALSLSAQTRFDGHSLLLSHSYFDGFESDENQYEQNLRSQTEARLSGSYRRGRTNILNYRVDWQGSDFDGGEADRRDQMRLYLGRSLGRFQVSHDLDYARVDRSEGVSEVLSGRLQTSGFLRGARIRFDTDYYLKNEAGLNALGVGMNYNLTRDLSAQLSARRLLRGAKSTSVQGNLDWHLNPLRVGLRAGYDTDTKQYIGVSATTSITRAPRRGWQLSSRTTSSQGAAMAHTFMDLNGNGVFDDEDEPMSGVGFGRNPLWRDIRTDEEGVAFLPGLPADRFVNVLVSVDSVEDPYLVTENEGLTTLVHAGGVAKLEFPFQLVGEIEGLVLTEPGRRPLRNVGLELLDAEGHRVASAVSEFDGYYLFDRVKPGTYTIRVVMTTLRTGTYHEPDGSAVAVPAAGDYVKGPTIVLNRIGVTADEPVVAEIEIEADPAAGSAPLDVAAATTPVDRGSGTGSGSGVRVTAPVVARTQDQPQTQAQTAPVPAAPRVAPVTVVAEAPATTPDVTRTLHLIHELLFSSPLFAR